MRAWASSDLPQRHNEVLTLLESIDRRAAPASSALSHTHKSSSSRSRSSSLSSSSSSGSTLQTRSEDGQAHLKAEDRSIINEDVLAGEFQGFQSGSGMSGGGKTTPSLPATAATRPPPPPPDRYCFQLGLEACAATADPHGALAILDRMLVGGERNDRHAQLPYAPITGHDSLSNHLSYS
jgi:hypothetical protein